MISILTADDERELLTVYKIFLEQTGYSTVHTCISANTALQRIISGLSAGNPGVDFSLQEGRHPEAAFTRQANGNWEGMERTGVQG